MKLDRETYKYCQYVAKDGMRLKSVPNHIKYNYDVVFVAVKKNYESLQYASKELQNELNIVLRAFNDEPYPSESATTNKELAIKEIKKNGLFLYFVSNDLNNDKEVVLEAVKQHNWLIEYASPQLKEEIGKNDPTEYLNSYLLSQKLEQEAYVNTNKKIMNNKI